MFVTVPDDREHIAIRMAELTAAIHRRELIGEQTTLRQLHHIAAIGQPEALNLADHLQRAGIVSIQDNIGDRFASTISLSETARRRLDQAARGKAA